MTISVEQVNDDVRALLGGIDQTIVDDNTLNKLIQRNIDKYGDQDESLCEVVYYTILDLTNHLAVAAAVDSATNGGSGAISSKREKEGSVEVETKYDTGNTTTTSSWEDIRQMFINDPTLVCDSLQDLTASTTPTTIVNSSGNKFGVKTPWRRSPYQISRLRRGR